MVNEKDLLEKTIAYQWIILRC